MCFAQFIHDLYLSICALLFFKVDRLLFIGKYDFSLGFAKSESIETHSFAKIVLIKMKISHLKGGSRTTFSHNISK